MKNFGSLILAATFALSANYARAIIPVSTPTEYVFVPAAGSTPGFGGALFLDNNSSDGGSLSDINLSESFLDTPNFDFNLSQVSDLSLNGVTFSWNNATITSMDMTGEFFGPGASELFTNTPTEISELTTSFADPGGNGMWVNANSLTSSVPDTGSTALMFSIAGVCVPAVRRYFKRNRRA
ncbi:MAG TPA: hypothetical protein VH619_19130 [Verrucomicrobiae bacterium]|jgi:hypothetical protein|nr:hypothetical protein [Verrucomicrobiae bacterium]